MQRLCPTNEQRLNTCDENNIIRPATANDLSGIITIHQKAFGDFFLTRLGGQFLHAYYSLVLDYGSGILLIYKGRNELQGFASGFVNPAEFYRLMWSRKLTLALPVVSALLRYPSLSRRVVFGIRRVHGGGLDYPPRSCELSSIAVAPNGTGNGLGKALVRAFLAKARSLGAGCVHLTTDADGNDSINLFYRSVGFNHTRRFLQGGGRWMNEYVISNWI